MSYLVFLFVIKSVTCKLYGNQYLLFVYEFLIWENMQLNLIAVSYQNIGPFKNKLLSIIFEKWNFLIKAPIWTGKSFLFFDGPTYALYKSGTRNLLNIQSQTGFIKLLFSINWELYFITRNLKQWKAKDSTVSHLYTCSLTEEEFLDKVERGYPLKPWLDIETILKSKTWALEEVVFKNETDLQQQLNVLLPPQEVFVSTIFLLQDSDNIFEMQPSERLEVLKNVFWLLWIDESKDIVKDKHKEVTFQIKALQDTSNYELKLNSYLWTILQKFSVLENNAISKDIIVSSKGQIEELESLKEKLSINNFALPEECSSFIAPLQESLKTIGEEYQKKQATLSAYQEQNRWYETQINSLQRDITSEKSEIENIEKRLANIDPQKLTSLREEKKKLQDQQDQLEQQAENDKCKSFYDDNKELLNLSERSTFSLRMNQQFIQELMAQWTSLKSKNELLERQLQNLDQKEKLEQESLKNQQKTLEERKLMYDNQLKSLLERLENFEKQIESEAEFSCEKINSQCPFIRVINKQHFEQREAEKKKILEEKESLEQKIKSEDFDKKLDDIKKKLENPESTSHDEKKQIKDDQLKNTKAMDLLRDFLKVVDYKKIDELNESFKKNENQISELEKQIIQQEELQASQEKFQQEKIRLETSIKQKQDQILTVENQKKELQEKITQLVSEIDKHPKSEISEVERSLEEYINTIQLLKNLIEDYNKMQVNLKGLIEEEKKLKILYWILNKDLLLFVLWEYLPVLTDIINSYLTSVTDYQISIKLKESSEKLELETKIIDEKGERDVKSLSWWQRTLLKLVWMLAISSYMKTEMLFLDETVNNLDIDTVWKVAQMLDDFVKQREMKFYTITHNSEIQSMKIWNATLEVWK